MNKITLIFALCIFFNLHIIAQDNISHTYTTNNGPDKNPMKGWNSGWWNDYEFSSVGFQYLKWNEFEPTDDNFNTDAIDNLIDRDGTKGRHVILRLYADWAGQNEESDAAPEWLFTEYGVERFVDNYFDNQGEAKTRYATNYNHPSYISEVKEAIEALAEYLDDDPRVYSIQIGVLGYWGEWHNFGFGNENDNSNNDDDGFQIAVESGTDILDTYNSNFSNKHLMGRYPWRDPLASDNTIGFHNDFFLPNNGHSDEFDNAILDGNKWLSGPIGGEVPPIGGNTPQEEEQNRQDFMTALFETNTGLNMINTGHYSTMQIGSKTLPCENDPTGDRCEGFLAMHRKMGYNFQITSAVFPDQMALSDNLTVDLNLVNIGVAPMYYDWDVQFALLNQDNEVMGIYNSSYDLRTITSSGQEHTIRISNTINGLAEDTYKLAVRIIQPDADQSKNQSWELNARNTYVLFANEIPLVDGTWDNNNALVGGWSILGNISLQEKVLSITDNEFSNRIKMYPSPSNSRLNIEYTNFALQSITIYDTAGQILKNIIEETASQNNIKTIDVSNLSTGIYYLTIKDINGNTSQNRFIKN